jgi:ABC-2 type transport system ATP-binding protein
MQHVLRVENLAKSFDTSRPPAVNGISFVLNQGEILGLLGPNGAGKSTTIQMLLGLLTPSAGSIFYFDKDFAVNRSVILESVTYATAYAKLPGQLTLWENLDIYGRLYGLGSAERTMVIEKYLKFFGLWNFRDRQTHGLSAGQMTRLMLAKAFLPKPRIVLLDEPTASLDPDIAEEVRAFVLACARDEATSILFTSHNMDEVAQVCGRVLVLSNGEIIASDTPFNLARQVSRSRVSLLLTHGHEQLLQFGAEYGHTIEHDGQYLVIEIDEQDIAALLIALASRGIKYSQIKITVPTLEDYFIAVSRRTAGGSL